MQFLADESCDFAVVRALRQAGYNVSAIAEISPRADDSTVITLALREKRILLTEDKDFGQLIYAHGSRSFGVVFIRYPSRLRSRLAQDVVHLTKKHGQKLAGCFIVLQPGRVRIHR